MPSSTRTRPTQSALPQLLPFPLGQPLAQPLLEAAVAQNRLAPAYLLAGPAGVGKGKAAEWLAAQILFAARRADTRLSQAVFVGQIQGGSYPDLVQVEPTVMIEGKPVPRSLAPLDQVSQINPQIRMEQAQKLRQQVLEAPLGRRWVVVIQGADQLTNEAGNALLKLVEERPNCTFILVADRLEQVMATIGSRCCTVRFGPLTGPDCRAVIVQHCPDLLNYPQILSWAAGSPGQAIWLYQLLSLIPEPVRQQVQRFEPTPQAAGMIEALKLARALSQLGLPVQQGLLSLLLHHCYKVGGSAELLRLLEQSLDLLAARVQAQGVWELLLGGLALQNLGWSGLDLPMVQAKCFEVKDSDLSASHRHGHTLSPRSRGRAKSAKLPL